MSAGRLTEGLWVCGACTSDLQPQQKPAPACHLPPGREGGRAQLSLGGCNADPPWGAPGEPPAARFQDGQRPGDAGLQPPSPGAFPLGKIPVRGSNPRRCRARKAEGGPKGAKLGPAWTSQGRAGSSATQNWTEGAWLGAIDQPPPELSREPSPLLGPAPWVPLQGARAVELSRASGGPGVPGFQRLGTPRLLGETQRMALGRAVALAQGCSRPGGRGPGTLAAEGHNGLLGAQE